MSHDQIAARIGGALRKLRARSGLSLRQVEAKSRVDFSQLGAIERGEALATIPVLERLAAVYGVTPASILSPRRRASRAA